jgi:uncharacterized protein (TIGR00106 family)
MEKLIVAEIVVTPIGTTKTGLSDYIAKAMDEIKKAGVKYQLHPMGTVFEADDLDTAFNITRACHQAVIKAGAKRVITTLRLDERLEQPRSMKERVERVMAKVK